MRWQPQKRNRDRRKFLQTRELNQFFLKCILSAEARNSNFINHVRARIFLPFLFAFSGSADIFSRPHLSQSHSLSINKLPSLTVLRFHFLSACVYESVSGDFSLLAKKRFRRMLLCCWRIGPAKKQVEKWGQTRYSHLTFRPIDQILNPAQGSESVFNSYQRTNAISRAIYTKD